MTATLGHRKELRFWGWGYADEDLLPTEIQRLQQLAARLGASGQPGAGPRLDDYDLPQPRVTVPQGLAAMVSVTPYDRISHAYGKSFADLVRMLMRHVPRPPDLVAFPRNEQDLADLLGFADRSGAAVIPFGGGTSVCGGVETDVGGDYSAVISVDLQYLNRVLEVDQAPQLFRAAFAGARRALDPQGLMNPGVLIDTPERGAVARGVMYSTSHGLN